MLHLKSTRQNKRNYASITYVQCMHKTIHCWLQGRIQGAHPGALPPTSLKLKKIWFVGVKSWFFTRNTPTIFSPPSARRNFFKYPPTWNPGSAPGLQPPPLPRLSCSIITAVVYWMFCFLRVTSGTLRNSLYVLTVIYL